MTKCIIVDNEIKQVFEIDKDKYLKYLEAKCEFEMELLTKRLISAKTRQEYYKQREKDWYPEYKKPWWRFW